MEHTPISHRNQHIAEPDEHDTISGLPTRVVPGSFQPEQLYASSALEDGWFDPWTGLPLAKHDMVDDSFNPLAFAPFAAGPSVQRRPSSTFSGVSTPSLSWRDSSCSPLSCIEESPNPDTDTISFPAARASQTQNLTSSPKSAFAGPLAALYAFQDELQAHHHTMYQPTSSMMLPASHDLRSWQAGLPYLETALQFRQGVLPAAPVVEPPPPALPLPPAYSHSPAPVTSAHMPELQHPRPHRPYVPPWQTATEFDLEEYVTPTRSTADYPDTAACRAGPSSYGETYEQEERQRRDGYLSDEEMEMVMDWDFQDQGNVAQNQPFPAPEACGWRHPSPSMFMSCGSSQRGVPQILPADSLLYQPIPSSVTSNLWTDVDPRSYAYPQFS